MTENVCHTAECPCPFPSFCRFNTLNKPPFHSGFENVPKCHFKTAGWWPTGEVGKKAILSHAMSLHSHFSPARRCVCVCPAVSSTLTDQDFCSCHFSCLSWPLAKRIQSNIARRHQQEPHLLSHPPRDHTFCPARAFGAKAGKSTPPVYEAHPPQRLGTLWLAMKTASVTKT